MRRLSECPVCGSQALHPFAMDEWNPGALHFAQVRCGECGLLGAQPQASSDEVEAYYASVYYEERWADADENRQTNLHFYPRYELPLIRHLWRDRPPTPGSSVLEVGCGYGVMLEVLRDAGYRVYGCDPSPKAVQVCRAKRLDVVRARAPELPFPAEAFDVVLSMHVIEHVPDPRAFIEAVARTTRPGGAVGIVTEDARNSQYAWDRVRARLAGRTPPFRSSHDHTFVFGALHLKRLLHDSGCDDVQTASFSHVPERESLHWRAYKGCLRLLDRMSGHGDYLVAVGRRRLPEGVA